MNEFAPREYFDTGVGKIRHEIKNRLVHHGFFGTITPVDLDVVDQVPLGAVIAITVKGRTVERSFDRRQIEGCRLRVSGEVLDSIVAMIDEVAVKPSNS